MFDFNTVVKGRHGTFIINKNDQYVGRAMIVYGEYGEQECDIISHLIGEGDVVVEAGANFGTLTIPMARRVGPTGRVYAFEPQKQVYYGLCGNVAANSLTNVECINSACGPEDNGYSWMLDIDYSSANNIGGMYMSGSFASDGVKVPVTSIDSLGLTSCALLKIDVEGYEKACLEGAAKTIETCHPILYVEDNRTEGHAPSIALSDELRAYIESLGYKWQMTMPSLYNPDNFFARKDNVFTTPTGGVYASYMLLCWHPKYSDIQIEEINNGDTA